MTTVYGLTPEGPFSKPLQVILDEIDSDLQGILGASAGTEPDGTIPPDSAAGQMKTMFADGIAAMWDLWLAAAVANDPGQAVAAQLDKICSITGTIREQQGFSSDTITCTGTPLTALATGRVVKTSDTGALFASTAAATIVALAAWAPTTAYVIGARVTNGNNCYQCTGGGTSAGSGGPSGTGSSISDGSVTWKFLGAGTGAIDVPFLAQSAGPIGA